MRKLATFALCLFLTGCCCALTGCGEDAKPEQKEVRVQQEPTVIQSESTPGVPYVEEEESTEEID